MKKKNYAAMAVALVTGGLAARAQAGLYSPTAVQNGSFDFDATVATPAYGYNQTVTGWYHATGGNAWQAQSDFTVANAPNSAYGVLSGNGTTAGELFQSIGTYTPNYNVSISMLEGYIKGDTGQNVVVSLFSGGTASTTYTNSYGTGYDTNVLSGATLLGSQTITDSGVSSFNSSSFIINTGTAGTKGATLWLDIATNDANTTLAIDSVVATGASTYNAVSWTGAVSNNWDSATLNFSNASGGVAYSDNLDVVFGNVAASKSSINLSTTVMPQSITFNNSTNTYTISGSGSIAGGTSLTKNGAGTVILNTSNSFTGPVAINAGMLVLQNGAALGTSQNVNLSSGATLAFQTTGGATFNNAVILNGAGSSGAGALLNLSGTNTLNGNVVLASTSTINVASGSLTILGSIYGTGGLNINGNGALTLNALDNFTGDSNVNGGTVTVDWYQTFHGTNLNISNATVNAQVSYCLQSTNTNVNTGGVLNLNSGFSAVGTNLNINGGLVNANASGGDAIGYGGTGYQVFTVNISNGGVFNDAANTNEGYDTQWNLTGGSITSTGGGKINIDAGSGYSFTSLASSTMSVISAPIEIRSGTLTFNVDQGTVPNGIDLDVSGAIIPDGGTVLDKEGPGTLALGGTITIVGGITVNDGTLMFGDGTSGHDGSLLASNQITLNNTANLTYNTYSLQSFGGTISGGGNGPNTLTKTGPGTLVLSGNTYFTGPTNVSAGKLYLNGSLSQGTGVTVFSGATLGGTGSVQEPVTVLPGGLIEAGQGGTGELTVNGLQFNGSGGITIGTLAGYASSPAIAVAGTLSTTGMKSVTLTVSSLAGVTTGTEYELLSYSNESGSGLGSYNLALPRGAAGTLSDNGSQIDLSVSSTGGAYSLIWTGKASTSWDTTTANNWNYSSGGTQSSTTYIDSPGDPVLFNDSPGSNQTVVIKSGDVHPASVTFNNSTYSYTITGTNAIAGNTALTLNGAGKVTLSNVNTFAGGITINAGTLSVGNDASLGAASGAVTLNGGTLQLNAAASLGSARTIVAGTAGGTIDPAGHAVTIASTIGGSSTSGGLVISSSTGSGTVAFTAAQNTDPGTLTINSGITLNLAAAVSVTPANTTQDFSNITVQSGATLDVATVHTFGYGGGFRPAITINGGTVTNSLGNDNYLGAVTMTAGTINGTGEFRLQNNLSATASTLSTLPSSTTATVSTTNFALVGYSGNPINFNISQGSTSSGIDLLITSNVDSSAPLLKTGAGTMQLASSNTYTGGTTINAGLLVASQGLSSLGNMNGGSYITINGGSLLLKNTPASTVYAMIQSGYNAGQWNTTNGSAITSVAAGNDPAYIHAVGMLQPVKATTFEGQPLGTGDVAVKYTYYGDANLDGKVDGSDYSVVDSSFLSEHFVNGAPTNPISGWQYGDFNYDGVVDGSDYTLMDNAFNQQGAVLASEIASPTAQIAGGTVAVPEPATLAMIGVGALGLLGRRKRR